MAGVRRGICNRVLGLMIGAACLSIGAASNTVSAAAPTCEQARGKTIVANTLARAFVRAERLYVCATESRRILKLGDYLPSCESSSGCFGAGKLRLAGRYLAHEELDATPNATTSTIYTVDTRRAQVRRVWREKTIESMEYTSVRALVATRLGGVAWISLSGQTGVPAKTTIRVFRANAGASPELLDQVEGLDIELGSLALAEGGRSIYWTHSGQPRTAAIR